MKQIVLPFYARLAFVLVSIIAIVYITYLGENVLVPLLFSFLFAMLLLPFCRFLEIKCRLPRGVASMISVLIFASVLAGVAYAVGLQLTMLIKDFPKLRTQIQDSLDDLHYYIQHRAHLMHLNVNKQLRSVEKGAADAGTDAIGATMLSISSTLLFSVFTFIYTFFMLFYRKLLVNFLFKVFSADHENTITEITAQIQFIVKKYITGLFLEMCAVATLVFSMLGILGVRYALLLGLVTAIFNLIPYVGIFTAMAISMLITLGTLGLTKALMVGGAIVIVHLLDSNIIMPRVVGSKVQINALVVILSVVIGEMVWGVSGMFLAVPVVAIIKIIFDRVEDLKPWGYLLGGLEIAKPVKLDEADLAEIAQEKAEDNKLELEE